MRLIQRLYKKAAAFVLRAVSKHSPELAQAVVASGGVDALVVCLEDFDPGVKEAAALALGFIAHHNDGESGALSLYSKLPAWQISFTFPPPSVRVSLFVALSQSIVDAGAVPMLVLCLLEPEIALKRTAASVLSDIAKHTPELAQIVVEAGAIAHLAQMILNPDTKLRVRTTEEFFFFLST